MHLRKHRTRATQALALACLAISVPAAAQNANGVGTPFELAFWQSVAGSDDPAVYDAYLQQYPTGTFAGLARAKLANLRKVAAPAAPAPVAAPIPQPAPQSVVAAPAPTFAADTPPATATPAVVVRTPVTAPLAASAAESDAALLSELARSQEPGAGTAGVAAAQGFALPPRPQLAEVADLALPASFCSAEQRNAFYETRYKPLLELSRANNAAAIAYMEKLQAAYDSYQLARDPTPMNALAAEARDYQQQVAAVTYSRQSAVVRQFDAIMAVPVSACTVTVAAK